MVDFSTQNIITFSAVIVALLSLGFSIYFNKKTLNQSEINLEIQLNHKDRRKAIYNLHKLIKKSTNYESFKKEILIFINSFEGQFLLKEIIEKVMKGLNDLDEFNKKDPTLNEVSEDELQRQAEIYLKMEEQRQKEEIFEYEWFCGKFERRLKFFKEHLEKDLKTRAKRVKE